MLLGMLGLGIVWIVELPFRVLDLWWARRYDLTESGYLDWIFGHWLELGAAFISVCVALMIVMFLARWLGEIWWVPGAAAFVAIGAFFAFVQPYLVDTTPLRDPALQRSATEFERKQGVPKIPIRVEDVSGTTSQANAYAIGVGLAAGRTLEHEDRRYVLGRRGQGRARPRGRSPLEQPHPERACLVRASLCFPAPGC